MEEDERVGLPEAGDTVGDWRIVRFLGEGRSGTVFEVHGTKDKRRTGALKIHLGHTRKATKEEFKREIDFVRQQIFPEYMPAFLDGGTWNGIPFFVMGLAEQLPKTLPRRRLLKLMRQVCGALEAFHAGGYLHCDVKRENIGTINGRAALLDFGSVTKMDPENPPPPRRVGTWDYMAPEVREKTKLDQLADVYSLGVTLGKLCDRTGKRTFESLVVHATVNNRDERLQSIKTFRHELNVSKDRLARFKSAVIGAAAVVLSALIFVGVSYRHNREEIKRQLKGRENVHMHVRSGTALYLNCDFPSAYTNLNSALESKYYNPDDFKSINVKGLRDDSLRRIQEAGR